MSETKLYIAYFSIVFVFIGNLYSEELSKKGFFTHAAIFYWQAHEEGLSYAVKSLSTNKLAPKSKIINPEFEWDFGFQLGIGYRIPHDRWNLELQFSSFQTHADEEKEQDGQVLFPVWQKAAAAGPFFSEITKMHWRLHLGLVDLMLSKCCEMTKSLFLIPQMGIRVGSIRQKYSVEYSGGNFLMDEFIHMKNKYFGIGPSVGILGKWQLGKGFGLVAKSAWSLLFGEFYLHQDEYAGKEKLLGVHSILSSSKPGLENSLGVCWQHFFQGAIKRLELKIVWDELFFFSQNQLMHFVDPQIQGIFVSRQGNLAISGVEFNMRFDF